MKHPAGAVHLTVLPDGKVDVVVAMPDEEYGQRITILPSWQSVFNLVTPADETQIFVRAERNDR